MGEMTYHILSIEDNPADRYLIQKFFSPDSNRFQLHFAKDGSEALDYLAKRGKHMDAVRPNLILLDLNLPKKDGREVLREVKADSTLKDIPIFVFTTSRSESDQKMSLSLGAERFISKPADVATFEEIFATIRSWLETLVPN